MPEPLRTTDPRRVGAYEIVGLLGEGGQGAVYRGEGPSGEAVAVKLLHARFSGDAKARSRFAGELAHAERVAPFCTARVLDADLEGDRPYIVSEFVDGPSLAELISRGDPPRGPALERLAIATVTALAAIHEAGIVHRDFKPDNVIMGADGARVIDFGIARALAATGTLTSAVVGTPAYMAPEQISGERVGPATDVFAWGCTIAHAARGVPPFGNDSIPAVMHRILHEEPGLDGLAGPLRDLVGACLAKDPARRPTARQALLRLLGGGPDAPAETLLTEGSRAAATRPAEAYAMGGPPPGYASPPSYAGPPGYPSPAPPPPTEVVRGEGRRRWAPRVCVGAGVVLGAATFLPWAKVGVSHTGMHFVSDVASVSGIRTVWGILALIAAVLGVNIALTWRSTLARRLPVAWAAVPGAAAVAMVAGFLLFRDALHSKNPHYGLLSDTDLRGMGMAFHISLQPGVFLALAAAVAMTVAALASFRT